MATRVIGAFAEEQVLASIGHRARIGEVADDLFDFKLQEVTFGGQERAIARIVGDRVLEAVIVLSPTTSSSRQCVGRRIADLHLFAAVRSGHRQIVLDPLVTERDPAAGALFVQSR